MTLPQAPRPDAEGRPGTGTPAARARHIDWAGRILTALFFSCILFLGPLLQPGAWLADGIAQSFGDPFSPVIWMFLTLASGFVLSLPLLLVAHFWRPWSAYRYVFRLWGLAGIILLLLTPVRSVPGSAAPSSALFQILALSLGIGALYLVRRRLAGQPPPRGRSRRYGTLAFAIGLGLLFTLPWLRWGAFGSALDVVLGAAAALALGLAAGLLLDWFWFRLPLAADNHHTARAGLLSVIAASGALMILALGAGHGGVQIVLIVLLPALSWAIVGLNGRWHTLGLLISLTAAGPLLLVDSRELAIALPFGLTSLLRSVFLATTLAFFLISTCGLLLFVLRWQRGRTVEPTSSPGWLQPLLFVFPAILVAAATWIYAGAGRPGFHGERLFVILSDQADLGGAAGFEDPIARREYVYETLVNHAENRQASLRGALESAGIPYQPYYLMNALAVEGGPPLRLWLEARPDVARVLYNPTLRPGEPERSPVVTVERPDDTLWNLSIIGADRVWSELGIRGEGIVIGQSDSGVQWDHPELAGAYRGHPDNHDYNWYDPWFGSGEPEDHGGHGTHTLGTILGASTGVAPDATWFGCANLARNLGSPALYLDCMQFMLAPFPLGGDPLLDGDPALGAHVMNNSWGCPEAEGCDAESLLPAVRALRAAGIFVVVSAGNDGPECGSLNAPPAIYDEVFSVGAVGRNQAVTGFSSRGPVTIDGSQRVKPDIVAPGLEIVSAFPGNTYVSWQGTSMAGPHVAGVVALMWSANPELIGAVTETEQMLIDTAVPDELLFPDACGPRNGAPNNVAGYGLVDAYAAVQAALAATPSTR